MEILFLGIGFVLLMAIEQMHSDSQGGGGIYVAPPPQTTSQPIAGLPNGVIRSNTLSPTQKAAIEGLHFRKQVSFLSGAPSLGSFIATVAEKGQVLDQRADIVSHLDDAATDWIYDDLSMHWSSDDSHIPDEDIYIEMEQSPYPGEPAYDAHGFTRYDKIQRPEYDARFYEQMYLPASRIRVSELRNSDYLDALKVLYFAVHYKNSRQPFSEWKQYEKLHRYDWVTGVEDALEAIVKAIIGLIPVAGGILNAAAAPAWQAVANAQGDYAKFADQITDIKNTSAVGGYLSVLLSGTGEYGFQNFYYKDSDGNYQMYGQPYLDADGNFVEWDLPPNLVKKERLRQGPNGENYYRRTPLFLSKLRWSCQEMGAEDAGGNDDFPNLQGTGLRFRSMRRAYVYRALDTIACILFPKSGVITAINPNAVDSSGNIDISKPQATIMWTEDYRYSYNNILVGNMTGSIFPPTDEDIDIPGVSWSKKEALASLNGNPSMIFDPGLVKNILGYKPAPKVAQIPFDSSGKLVGALPSEPTQSNALPAGDVLLSQNVPFTPNEPNPNVPSSSPVPTSSHVEIDPSGQLATAVHSVAIGTRTSSSKVFLPTRKIF